MLAYPHSSVVVCHIAAQLDDLCHLHWVLSILLGPLYCITKTKWQKNVVQQFIATAMTFGANVFSNIMLSTLMSSIECLFLHAHVHCH